MGACGWFGVVTLRSARRRFPKRLDVVDVGHIGSHIFTACRDVVRIEFPVAQRSTKVLMQTLPNLIDQQLLHRLCRAGIQRLVSCRDGGAEIESGRLEACVRCTLGRPMHPNESFEEKCVRQLLRLRSKLANGQRVLESAANLGLIILHSACPGDDAAE
jgi:hypothetical protein